MKAFKRSSSFSISFRNAAIEVLLANKSPSSPETAVGAAVGVATTGGPAVGVVTGVGVGILGFGAGFPTGGATTAGGGVTPGGETVGGATFPGGGETTAGGPAVGGGVTPGGGVVGVSAGAGVVTCFSPVIFDR